MKWINKTIILAIGLCFASFANSTSYIDGLHFIKSPDLVIERQDVTLNLDQITLVYTLINTANQDITETLMFSSPMQHQAALLVDNNPVNYKILQRAISLGGIDVSNILRNLGLPFDPIKAMHALDNSANHDSLRKKLIALELIDPKDETPLWSNNTFYYWQQNFPAKSSIKIRHTYKPSHILKNLKLKGINEFIKMPFNMMKKVFFQEENFAEILKARLERHNPEILNYCPSRYDYLQIAANSKSAPENRSLIAKQLNYSNQTDPSWVTPANHFSLTIESPENMQPLLCWEDNFQRKGNHTLFFETNNYSAIKDINVLYIQRLGDNSGLKAETGN